MSDATTSGTLRVDPASARRRRLIAAAVVLMAIYALMSVLDARTAMQRLAGAESDLREVESKLADIRRWQRAPKVAALQLESPAEITNRIAAARQQAGIAQASLLREEPTDPQRIARTDFTMRTTSIELAAVPLPKLIRFCEAMEDAESGTLVRDIRLTSPKSGETTGDQEAWEASLTLTQIIFSPTSR